MSEDNYHKYAPRQREENGIPAQQQKGGRVAQNQDTGIRFWFDDPFFREEGRFPINGREDFNDLLAYMMWNFGILVIWIEGY